MCTDDEKRERKKLFNFDGEERGNNKNCAFTVKMWIIAWSINRYKGKPLIVPPLADPCAVKYNRRAYSKWSADLR